MPGAPYVVSQPMAMDGAYMTGAPYTTYGGYSMSPYMPAMPAVGGLDHSQGKWFAPGEALPPGYVMTAHPEGHTAPQEGHAMSEMASASFVIPASSAAAAVKTGSAVTAEGLDTSATRVQDAFDTFAKKEANMLAQQPPVTSTVPVPQSDFHSQPIVTIMIPGAFHLSSSSAGVQAGQSHGIPLPQIIYEKKRQARSARCFADVEEFLQKQAVSCRRVSVQRTFLHLHQDVKQPPKKKQRQNKESEEGRVEVPAWEEYLKSNGFTNCQLVQTFVWRTKQKDQKDQKDEKDKLIFACVPYPSRPDSTLLGEVLQDDDLVQCKLKEVQSITKRPLFVCLPFAVPEGSVVVADEQLRAESKELLFDCGTVALLMSQGEFWRSVKPANGTTGSLSARPKREFEVMGSSSFEPPEQRLVRLQAEVSELLKYTEKSAAKERRSHSAAVLFNSVKQCFQ
eukprot:symbB.v1.2.002478.t2/scaffold99.1/size346285/34